MACPLSDPTTRTMAGGLVTNELSEADVIRFDVLPDDVLLDIFDFYLTTSPSPELPHRTKLREEVEAWQTLVHVCGRWRSLIFRSPRRLNLRLVCTPEICTKDKLDVWPALPLIVEGDIGVTSGTDNIIEALGHSNRVSKVDLTLSYWRRKEVLAMMQVPFPELTVMQMQIRILTLLKLTLPAIPDSFLGGSAPRLRHIIFNGIPFPGLPKLLFSATHLVKLWLINIPPSGYVSPEAMVASLSTLSSLESLCIEFEDAQPCPNWEIRRPPPPKRSILPTLERFRFEGTPEYLEDLVSRIDTPQLDLLRINFLHRIYSICTRFVETIQFINRTPKHGKCKKAHLEFDDHWQSVGVSLGILHMFIMYSEPVWRLSSAAQVNSSSVLSMVEDLYIESRDWQQAWKHDAIENTLWFQFLLPFTAVKDLYLDEEFAPSIATALQVFVPDRVTVVLPSLQNIFVKEIEPSFEISIRQFLVTRQLSGHPVAISDWPKHPDLESM